MNSLLASNTYFPKLPENIESKRSSNAYFKPITLGLSVLFGFEFEKTTLTFKLNHGLTDKIKGNNQVKEYDSSLNIGMLYYFKR